jgi:membrane-associated phospholipid phosphatase
VRAALVWIGGRLRALLAAKLGITVALTALFCACWYLIPRHLVVPPRTLPLTDLERSLPFVEGWVYVYLSVGLFNIVAPYLTMSRSLLQRHVWGFTAITAASFVCFVLFPVEVPAPTGRATTLLYGFVLADTRLNNFPSLHASYTVYGLLYWMHILPEIPPRAARHLTAIVVAAWGAALILSALFLKQHCLADLAAGGALGGLTYWLGFRRPAGDRPEAFPLAAHTETNS